MKHAIRVCFVFQLYINW